MKRLIYKLCGLLFLIVATGCPGSGGVANPDPSPLYYLVVTAGYEHSAGIKSDGTLWTWGDNSSVQLGDGNSANTNVPAQIVADVSNWSKISAGSYHTLGLRTDGTLWAWGKNDFGQLGNGMLGTDKNTPTRVGTASNWSSISAGVNHNLAIKSDGTLWAWGKNDQSQLGNGAAINLDVPTQIGSGTNWASATAGDQHSLGIKTDGTLWGWGSNAVGQFGNGSNTSEIVPVRIDPTAMGGGLSTWSAVSAGAFYTIGIQTDGTLWASGLNDVGQLGIGSTTNTNSFTKIGTATNWAAIDTGKAHNVGRRDNQSVSIILTWGDNSFGQLGDGTIVQKNSPVQLSNIDDINAISAGGEHTLTRLRFNSKDLFAWGKNDKGQLGVISNVDKDVPTRVLD